MLSALLVAGAACSHSTATRATRRPAVVLNPEGQREGQPEAKVLVEVARSDSERQRGLMFRDRLLPGWGMLFLFDGAKPLTFWMRNTYVPLDMIFIDANYHVVGVVHDAEPLTDEPRRVEGDAQFVLEVEAGWAAAHGVNRGARVRFIDVN